jgi:hypothetical protein
MANMNFMTLRSQEAEAGTLHQLQQLARDVSVHFAAEARDNGIELAPQSRIVVLTAALSVAMVHAAEASVRNGGQTAYNDPSLIIAAFLEYFKHGQAGISQEDAWAWLVAVSTGKLDDSRFVAWNSGGNGASAMRNATRPWRATESQSR